VCCARSSCGRTRTGKNTTRNHAPAHLGRSRRPARPTRTRPNPWPRRPCCAQARGVALGSGSDEQVRTHAHTQPHTHTQTQTHAHTNIHKHERRHTLKASSTQPQRPHVYDTAAASRAPHTCREGAAQPPQLVRAAVHRCRPRCRGAPAEALACARGRRAWAMEFARGDIVPKCVCVCMFHRSAPTRTHVRAHR
jgi:hypothetical protein